MNEYKGKVKGERINIDTVLDEFNRLTLGESRGRPSRGRPSRARGSHDSLSNEDESMEEKPRNKKENKVVLKKE